MSTLEEWTTAVRTGLEIDSGPLSTPDTRAVLDLARDVSHAVNRPAAPLTAYLLGVAVGRGLTLPDASDRVRALAADWTQDPDPADGPQGLPDPLRRAYGTGRHRACSRRRPPQWIRGVSWAAWSIR